MAPLLNAKGRPVKMSFFDLFTPGTPSRSGKGTPRQERKKPKKGESSPIETAPKSTAATEAPTESPKTTEPGSAEWTRIEELGLLGMKALNMNWKDIGEALPGKDEENIKKKYKELYLDAPANVKPKEVEAEKEATMKETAKNQGEKQGEKKEEGPKIDEAKIAEESKEGNREGKKGGKEGKQGKKGQKGQVQRGKEKAEAAKPEEVKVEEAKPKEKMGTLKAKATAEERGKGGELKSIGGHPVIFVDDNEELEFEELRYLYGLNARCDEQKWINVDSKFFDRFGKRIGAEKLKAKLAGSC